MRIAILAHGLRAAGGLSVATNLIAALGRQRNAHRFLIVVPSEKAYQQLAYPAGASVMSVRMRLGWFGRVCFDSIVLPGKVRAFRPDVLFCMGNFGLTRPPCPQAILFHKPQMVYQRDLWDRENLSGRIRNALIKTQIKRSLSGTQLVMCQTEVIARRFREVFGYTGDIRIRPNAVSQVLKESELGANNAIPAILSGLENKALLFSLTRYYPHKNLEAIVECFTRYPDEMSGVVCLITISASDHPRAAMLLRTIKNRGLEQRIINIGPIRQEALPAYYRQARALLLPTLIESFSATYIEAMAYGCPIVTSNLDFAREICADAALYFDPNDPASMKNAILAVARDNGICRILSEKGRNRARMFWKSWDDIAGDIIGDLEEIAGERASKTLNDGG